MNKDFYATFINHNKNLHRFGVIADRMIEHKADITTTQKPSSI